MVPQAGLKVALAPHARGQVATLQLSMLVPPMDPLQQTRWSRQYARRVISTKFISASALRRGHGRRSLQLAAFAFFSGCLPFLQSHVSRADCPCLVASSCQCTYLLFFFTQVPGCGVQLVLDSSHQLRTYNIRYRRVCLCAPPLPASAAPIDELLPAVARVASLPSSPPALPGAQALHEAPPGANHQHGRRRPALLPKARPHRSYPTRPSARIAAAARFSRAAPPPRLSAGCPATRSVTSQPTPVSAASVELAQQQHRRHRRILNGRRILKCRPDGLSHPPCFTAQAALPLQVLEVSSRNGFHGASTLPPAGLRAIVVQTPADFISV